MANDNVLEFDFERVDPEQHENTHALRVAAILNKERRKDERVKRLSALVLFLLYHTDTVDRIHQTLDMVSERHYKCLREADQD